MILEINALWNDTLVFVNILNKFNKNYICVNIFITTGSGFAVFPLIRKDYHCDHVILQKKLQFPWKTDAFKGIVEVLS